VPNASPKVAASALVLDLTGVGLTYASGVTALNDLNLSIPAGSFHAVLGPSGCGKSTLLKAVAGLLRPDRGEIRRLGDGHFAYVPQGNSCFPWLRAEDNVGYGLRLKGIARTERTTRARALLEDLGLGAFSRTFPGQLSEGMRQRVAIARAFALDAPILLMDEPLSALDFQTKISVQRQLLGLWNRTGCAIVYVTHDIDEALALADEVSVLSPRPGRVLETIGVPFERPRSYASIRESADYGRLFRRLYTLLGEQ
jgi:NitT/TauT family transport system ATP-binding protein